MAPKDRIIRGYDHGCVSRDQLLVADHVGCHMLEIVKNDMGSKRKVDLSWYMTNTFSHAMGAYAWRVTLEIRRSTCDEHT